METLDSAKGVVWITWSSSVGARVAAPARPTGPETVRAVTRATTRTVMVVVRLAASDGVDLSIVTTCLGWEGGRHPSSPMAPLGHILRSPVPAYADRTTYP